MIYPTYPNELNPSRITRSFSKRLHFTATTVLLFSCFLLSSVDGSSRVINAPSPLPHVTGSMEKPDFWVKKIVNPDRVLMSSVEIRDMNEKNLKRDDLFLCKVRDLKEEWNREEILALLKEDWQGFGDGEIRYNKKGALHGEAFWSKIRANLNEETLKETNRMLWGLIVRRTSIRVFPTEDSSFSAPGDDAFDQFQHSAIAPGSVVGIYHVSRDGTRAYVQTSFIRGWVRVADLAVAKERNDVRDYEEAAERLVVTGSSVPVYRDPEGRKTHFTAQMGTSFPFFPVPQLKENSGPSYVIRVPIRDADGHLTFGKGYIPKTKDVRTGFLAYTQRNVALQAFKMLHEPYGWGEWSGGRDCSRFIMDIFNTFGILMPRNSRLQAQIGIGREGIEGRSLQEKKKMLDETPPLATTLRLPGHIMLYLGRHRNTYYVIHSLWGVQKTSQKGPVLELIGKVAVSDLSLGETGPKGSLLERISDIRYVGTETR